MGEHRRGPAATHLRRGGCIAAIARWAKRALRRPNEPRHMRPEEGRPAGAALARHKG